METPITVESRVQATAVSWRALGFAIVSAFGAAWCLLAHAWPWFTAFFVVIFLIALAVMAWHIYEAWQVRRLRFADRRADVAQKEAQLDMVAAVTRLLVKAEAQGDNVKVLFSKDGTPSSVEVIRAAVIASEQRRPRIEDVSERTKIPEQAASTKSMMQAEFPQPLDFRDVLDRGFVPSPEGIYLMQTVQGPVIEKTQHLTHIGLTGPSGSGKTTFNREITTQLQASGAEVYLASPNFAPVKLNGYRMEDWRPIMRWLKAAPAQSAAEIDALLNSFLDLFEKRKAAEQNYSPRRGKDVFLILGEWPGIVARVKNASQILGLLLRESRQYGIHIMTEMQDALVKTTNIDTGMIENLRTSGYFGGDKTTARRVLDLKPGQDISEEGLGQKGALWLRSYTRGLNAGRVPLFSNEAMYELLGWPPDPVTDEEVFDERLIPAKFQHYTSVDIKKRRFAGQPQRSYSTSTMVVDQGPRYDRRTGPLSGFGGAADVNTDEIAQVGASDIFQNGAEEAQIRADKSPGLANTGTPENLSERALDVAGVEPDLGPDDLRLNDLQMELFKSHYRILGNIVESLAAIKNDKGQGLGKRYSKHASWLVKQYNLRKSA